MDNLNTHTPAAFYETFAPAEARRLVERFEFHFTPKHGSWLNMAEIELSALVRQWLNRRMPNLASVAREVQAWQQQRNDEWVRHKVGAFAEGAARAAAPAAPAQAAGRERAAIWGYALGVAQGFAGAHLPIDVYRQQSMTRARGARIC